MSNSSRNLPPWADRLTRIGWFPILIIAGVGVYLWDRFEYQVFDPPPLALHASLTLPYQTIRIEAFNLTSAQWSARKATYLGEQVCWRGWVVDVDVAGRYADITIDMDDPGEALSMPDVYLRAVPAAGTTTMQRDQSVWFTGVITKLYKLGSALQVIIEPAKWAPVKFC